MAARTDAEQRLILHRPVHEVRHQFGGPGVDRAVGHADHAQRGIGGERCGTDENEARGLRRALDHGRDRAQGVLRFLTHTAVVSCIAFVAIVGFFLDGRLRFGFVLSERRLVEERLEATLHHHRQRVGLLITLRRVDHVSFGAHVGHDVGGGGPPARRRTRNQGRHPALGVALFVHVDGRGPRHGHLGCRRGECHLLVETVVAYIHEVGVVAHHHFLEPERAHFANAGHWEGGALGIHDQGPVDGQAVVGEPVAQARVQRRRRQRLRRHVRAEGTRGDHHGAAAHQELVDGVHGLVVQVGRVQNHQHIGAGR